MAVTWVRRNSSGIVKAAYLAEYVDAEILKKLRESGIAELVSSDQPITVNAPLPGGAVVCK